MRHTIEFDHENKWVLTRFRGPLLIDEAVALLKTSVSFPEWSPAWDRIIDYSDGLLGDLDVEAVQRGKVALGEVLSAAYGGKPTLSAQVCADPIKLPLIKYWIGLGDGDYPAGLKLFDSIAEAQAWILASRAAR
ncbi:hypothetical protein [Maricaulis salignorans]|uniref:SpoIIAA-like n=1 Tax=Maricaulis salignorans TaxID=144026 RepID=A0A1G9V094_9PROT|nr:hypothetical protein [Maricaulis salignorans]SDM65533.1 hypothetical protein SAMN04488568_11731 [Maricaulis salignorans]